jgi:hypothetical protein
VQPARYALAAKQQDGEEARFQEKRAEYLIAGEGPDDIAGDSREAAPVGAELVGQHHAGNDAHAERHRENLGPEPGDPEKAITAGQPRRDVERGDIGRQSDGEAWKDDVERDGEGKLQPRQQDRIEIHDRIPQQRVQHARGVQSTCRPGC